MAEFSNHVGCNFIIITSVIINGEKERDNIKHTTFPGSSGSRLLHINSSRLTPAIIYNIQEIGYFPTSYHKVKISWCWCILIDINIESSSNWKQGATKPEDQWRDSSDLCFMKFGVKDLVFTDPWTQHQRPSGRTVKTTVNQVKHLCRILC